MATAVPFTEEDLHELYTWIDEIPISRPKRNIARDFADGCCVAEVVKFFFPRIVDIHNYAPAMSARKKRDNWATLNAKVFRKLYFEVPQEEIEDIVSAVPGAIERFLRALRIKISQIRSQREQRASIGWDGAAANRIGGNGGAYMLHDDESAGDLDDAAGAHYNGHSRPSTATSGGGVRYMAPHPQQQQQRRSSTGARLPVAAAATRSGMTVDSGSAAGSMPPGATHDRLLEEKDRVILELRETVGILSEKIMKLEELVKVKDEKLNQYRAKFGKA